MPHRRIRFLLLLDDEEHDNDVRQNRISLFHYHRRNYDLNSVNIREAFRVDREVIMEIEQHIGRYLQKSRRNNSLDARQQILTALQFVGNAAQYHSNGRIHGVSKSTVFRCIHNVCRLIVIYLMPFYIRWPTTSILEERKFFNIAGFPHVKGVIDGTLIHINGPHDDEPVYVARDNKHAINLILVSGPSNEFFFASAKSPGSFHDSRALRISRLWQVWENQHWRPDNDPNSIILGDSAYPLMNWLIPPVVSIQNANIRHLADAVSTFGRIHRKTRCIVECSIGILKNQFRCLQHLRIRNPTNISTVIYACVTLHNMQNRFHRGSYAYDEVLNRLANGGQQLQPIIEEDVQPAELQLNIDGINRQREILEYFALNR